MSIFSPAFADWQQRKPIEWIGSSRAVYTVKLAGVVYVLHVFQKKATRGIATPKHELATIRSRWKRAKMHYAANYLSTRNG